MLYSIAKVSLSPPEEKLEERKLKLKNEQNILKLSISVTLCIAVFGIVMGILTGSSSVIFDGVYSAVDCFFSVAALCVSRLIQLDTAVQTPKSSLFTKRFQFGFWHLEPLLLAFNSLSLMIAILYGMAEAITAIWHGGHVPTFGSAILYAIIAIAVCYGLAFYEMRANRKIKSDFIAIDVKSWLISGGISTALLLAFVFALLVENTPARWLIPYIDPAALVVICLFMAPMPVRIMIKAVKEIFLITSSDIDERVTCAVDAVVKRYGLAGGQTYVVQVGRSTMIEVHLLLSEHYKIGTVAVLDKIRGEIGDAIGGYGPDRWFTVCFTARREWI